MRLEESKLDAASKEAIIISTAESMKIDQSNVRYTRETLLGSTELQIRGLRRRRLQTTLYDIEVVTTTTVSVDDFPEFGTDSKSLYNTLSQNLKISVTNGHFTSTLQARSQELGATATLNARNITVMVSDPERAVEPSALPTSAPFFVFQEDNQDRSLGLLVGIAISCFLAAVFFIVLVYYGYRYYRSCLRQKILAVEPGFDSDALVSSDKYSLVF